MEEKTKDNEDIVLERSPEVNQMYVGHRKVKVWMGSRLQLFYLHSVPGSSPCDTAAKN